MIQDDEMDAPEKGDDEREKKKAFREHSSLSIIMRAVVPARRQSRRRHLLFLPPQEVRISHRYICAANERMNEGMNDVSRTHTDKKYAY
jgi:hypothetical protein|tara:strand:- start:278 stop:544 length:267 start_codon:yes stop_codon:yes gene_type:complete